MPIKPSLILLLALPFFFANCVKKENTTPRYDAKACVLCTHYENGKCFNCKGSGVCQYCKGSGKRLVGKKNNFIEEACPFCEGRGKCHYCKGSGNCNGCTKEHAQDTIPKDTVVKNE